MVPDGVRLSQKWRGITASRISNALVLLLLFFIVVNPEEATVFFKLNSIDTNVGQITAIPVPYVVTTTISIMVDLFLLIAIEDASI
ncbi:hypothetical protein IscW_ISCW008077 [Ixodes scapularis]|uniref:Uncharacterized protein n=1 Tax=Ixodes scapularis TaxID=6945 RepID=B7PTJ8_IXOSC|nr:hypothetical protein IscW_ISCW008077 [Ixodes scapularis]|eukprot:XP_002404520.1 hypothetical protein IscW_ISCW008077 [Ixodes scapularis]